MDKDAEDEEAEYGGAPACTGTGGGIGFGGDVDGGCCVRAANDGAGALPAACAVYGVVEGMGDGAGDGSTYVGYGPCPLKSRRTFCSNSLSALGSMLSCHSR